MPAESDSKVVAEDEDKKKYEYSRDRVEKEKDQIPSSSKHTPVHLKMNAERRTDEIVGTAKGVEMDVLDNIQATTVPYLQEKPWMKAGADISDYFNYGFDEESWKAYCKKQAKIHADHKKLYTKTRKGHNKHGEKELCDYSSPGSPSIPASSESSATAGVTGGQLGCSSRVKGRCRLSDQENNTQMVTEMSPKQDIITSYHLVTPSNFSSLFPYTSPPPFLYQLGLAPLSTIAALDSGHAKEFDDPSTSAYPCSSAVSSLIPRSMASSTGVINYAKAWECYIWQEKCDRDRDRSRESHRDRGSKRGRDRESKSRSSSHHSGEERMRHRDTVERGHKRHRDSGEKEDRKGRRHNERRQKSSRSSGSGGGSRRDDGKDRESRGRHKHKKAKRKRKD